MHRFILDPVILASGADIIEISGGQAHHALNVLRLKPTDPVVLIDGCGGERQGAIIAVTNASLTVRLECRSENTAESAVHITLAQAMLKDRKQDEVVRRLTELGVNRFICFHSRYSIPKPDENRFAKRLDRWRAISDEALKQCGRNRRLDIRPLMTIETVLAAAGVSDIKLICHAREKTGLRALSGDHENTNHRIFVVTGPEGGFSPPEITLAARFGFVPVSIGPRILRAETAAIAIAAVLQFQYGDMGA